MFTVILTGERRQPMFTVILTEVRQPNGAEGPHYCPARQNVSKFFYWDRRYKGLFSAITVVCIFPRGTTNVFQKRLPEEYVSHGVGRIRRAPASFVGD